MRGIHHYNIMDYNIMVITYNEVKYNITNIVIAKGFVSIVYYSMVL